MNKQIDELSLQLADAIYADQHPVTGTGGPEYNAFELGEYIYSVQVESKLGDAMSIDVFTQWPRLHHWIREKLDKHVELNFATSIPSGEQDQVLVKVTEPGSKIRRTAFLTREMMLEMLQERGVPESMYLADGLIDTLWYKVLDNECL